MTPIIKNVVAQSRKSVISTCIASALFSSTAYTQDDSTPVNERRGGNSQSGIFLENLDRGLVVIPTDGGNAISWRMLGTDSDRVSFDVYRNGRKINGRSIRDKTFLFDRRGGPTDKYELKVTGQSNGRRNDEKTSAARPWSDVMLRIPLNTPKDGWVKGATYSYSANDGAVADLTGDGRYELIVKWYPSNAKDNSQSGFTGPTYLDAYTLEGKQLWRIDLGNNIRSGAHYTQFVAYDFDQDGRAEVAMKTADGSMDSEGSIIGDEFADYRNSQGYVLDGPEYLTMFDGLSGKALDTIDYIPQRGNVDSWGDGYGNRVDRFLAGVGYFNGETPSVFFARGYYTRAVVSAFDWVNKSFVERWVYDSDNGGEDAGGFGQGAHSVSVGDADNDGKDEIIYGSATIDDDGHLLYSTELGHGDALHMTDINPYRPGQEIFMVHEDAENYIKDGVDYAVELHDAATGEILWSRPGNGDDVGRGVSGDIDPGFAGNENWGTRGGLVAADGTLISDVRPSQVNFMSWWDGDLTRELLDDVRILKWQPATGSSEVILDGSLWDAVSNNGTKATPVLSADIVGDWREEVIWANSDSSELLLFSTTEDTEWRIPTLMHDTQYRTAIAWQNVGYNQPPHPSFYLGSDMAQVPNYAMHTAASALWIQPVARGKADSVEITVHDNGYPYRSLAMYKSTEPSPESSQFITTLSKGRPTYIDSNVEPDTTYYYWGSVNSRRGNPIYLPVTKTQLTTSEIPNIRTFHESSNEPVQLSWFIENVEVSSITVYRADVIEGQPLPESSQSTPVAELTGDLVEWTDESTQPGSSYYYWLSIAIVDANEPILTNSISAEHLLTPKTHLTTAQVDGGIQVSWELEDFPQAIRGIELYRNTREELNGRTRINPSAAASGTLTDTLDLVAGTTYWYMFKLAMEDGTTYNTDPEAAITFSE